MMKYLLCCIAFVALLMVTEYHCKFQGQEGIVKIKMCYFPIEAETLTPVTSANIQERGRYCEIHSAKDTEMIKSVLRGATKPSSHKFSDHRVRVKLIETSSEGDKLIAFVEKEGEVRFADGSEGTISPGGMKVFKNIINAQCKK
jgi:hypothetical protein